MKHILCRALFLLSVLTLVISCGPTDSEKATVLVGNARSLVEENRLNAAKTTLDSVHSLYPKCVAERRMAKALQDSIDVIEARRTLAFADSVLAILLPRADSLLPIFRYEKNERYEDEGRYVHRLLRTDANTSRCYLQAYVTDARHIMVKSYYFGSHKLQQSAVELQAGDDICTRQAASHTFEANGWHSILTLEDDAALEVLYFISAHRTDRCKVLLSGSNAGGKSIDYSYYISDTEKNALQDTYKLALVMSDIRKAEQTAQAARRTIEKKSML